MDVEKLIRRLRNDADAYRNGETLGRAFADQEDVLDNAATVLSTLQAENEKLKDQLYDGEGVNLVNYWMQQAKIEENGHRNCQTENEKLRAELEQVKQKYSEAREAICTHCMDVPCRGESCYWWRG